MEIKIIKNSKKDFLDLLLLADEQDKIDKYLDSGTLFALYDGDLKSICLVTDEGNGCYEIQNLATYEQFQRKGYGRHLVNHVCDFYREKGNTMLVGTADAPFLVFSYVSFYESCGFVFSHRIENYILENYDKPQFEMGVQLKDKVYLKMNLQA